MNSKSKPSWISLSLCTPFSVPDVLHPHFCLADVSSPSMTRSVLLYPDGLPELPESLGQPRPAWLPWFPPPQPFLCTVEFLPVYLLHSLTDLRAGNARPVSARLPMPRLRAQHLASTHHMGLHQLSSSPQPRSLSWVCLQEAPLTWTKASPLRCAGMTAFLGLLWHMLQL